MLDLLDYRRQVFEMYRAVRLSAIGSHAACQRFRTQKDKLFRRHPQSPVDITKRTMFRGLHYFDHDPEYAVVGDVDIEVTSDRFDLDLGDDGRCSLRRVGRVTFKLPTGTGSLFLYWIEGYGGGIFLPFRDTTAGIKSYGGGRYLFDTIKGADLGTDGRQIRLDFNYAYHPSCAYNPRWICPLARPENRLSFPILAGERTP